MADLEAGRALSDGGAANGSAANESAANESGGAGDSVPVATAVPTQLGAQIPIAAVVVGASAAMPVVQALPYQQQPFGNGETATGHVSSEQMPGVVITRTGPAIPPTSVQLNIGFEEYQRRAAVRRRQLACIALVVILVIVVRFSYLYD